MSKQRFAAPVKPAESALAPAVAEQAAAQDQAAAAVAEQPAAEQTPAPAAETAGVADASVQEQVKVEEPAPAAAAVAQPAPAVQEPAKVISGLVVDKPTSAVTTAPVAAPVAGVGQATAVTSNVAVDALQERLDRILKNVPAASYNDITRIRLYCKAMAPGRPIDAKQGATEQAALYRSIQNIINRQEVHFTALFTALLAVFDHERKGALSDSHRNRFMEHVVLSLSDRNAFTSLTHLLSITAASASRELALKQVDMEKALSNGLTAEGQQRVLAYFGK